MKPDALHYEDKLLEFAYGELPAHEAGAVQAHVEGCARCRQALAEIRGVRSAMQQLPRAEAPSGGLDSLLAYAEAQAARNAQAVGRPWWAGRWGGRWLAPLASAAALTLVAVVAWRAQDDFHPASPAVAAKSDVTHNGLREASDLEERAEAPAAPAREAQLQRAQSAPAGEPAAAARGAELGRLESMPSPKASQALARKKGMAKVVAADRDEASDYSNAAAAGSLDAKKERRAADKLSATADYGLAPAGASASLAERKVAERVAPGGGGDQAEAALREAPAVAAAPAAAPAVAAAPAPPPQSKQSLDFSRSKSPSLRGALAGGGAGATGDRPSTKDDAEPGPTAEVQAAAVQAARQASRGNDRRGELRYALEALQAGVTGTERAEMLSRACSAAEALGDLERADRLCDQLLTEFPGSRAAQELGARRGMVQKAPARSVPPAEAESAPAENAKPAPLPAKK
jgi:hypothetical protein